LLKIGYWLLALGFKQLQLAKPFHSTVSFSKTKIFMERSRPRLRENIFARGKNLANSTAGQ